ncbi:hypothetical protein NESM_000197300 [Novymonas esmeraldas]|uniref:Uncharacterized protein n=1 Tax=Novymonas esmeraldas TaxID=1808958 RepID=A0AAW0F7W3_9TRYP
MSTYSSEKEYPPVEARSGSEAATYPEEEGYVAPATPAAAEEEAHAASLADAREANPAYAAAKAELEAVRAAHEQRIREIMHDNPFECDVDSMPSLEELRDERLRLSEQVRHHKDEQDSLALDIEGQEGAADVYQLAARVQRLEHFAERASQYANQALPQEIEKTVEEDRHQSNMELCTYIQELQSKRSNTLKRVVATQESMSKKHQRQTAAGQGAAKDEEEDPMEAKAAAHTQENKDESVVLQQKIRKFRSMKTKLQSDIAKEKSDSKKMEESMLTRIRAIELANSRDARQCKELNNRNAAVTTNSQLLMDQLNVEHYGFNNAPSTKQLLADRKEREATPEPTPVEQQHYARYGSGASVGSRQSHTNSVGSRQRAAKPPLVALKRTESQRARDNAAREEREEATQSQRRNSDAASYQSSRRQSISKPPLVASKPTASQQNRDNALREGREEASVSRHRPRSNSISSDVRPPSSKA